MGDRAAKALNIGTQIIRFTAIALSLYHISVGYFGVMSSTRFRAIHLMVLLCLGALGKPLAKDFKLRNLPHMLIDALIVISALSSNLYLILTESDRMFSYASLDTAGLILACALILSILEMARRLVSPAMSVTTLIILLYAFFGHYISGAWGHRAYSFTRVITYLFTAPDGIYGTPLGISATMVILFVIFGHFLGQTGGATFFIDFATGIFGDRRGGPAKASIVSSALMGTMSGSPTANVVATGTFTIPLMKRTGYEPRMAGAIEAVASTGGLMVPPVMGATAFLMAEYLGIAYVEVAVIAILPAVLYYVAIFFSADIEARRLNLGGISKEEKPSVRQVVKERGHVGIIIVVLFVMLGIGFSAQKSICISLACLVVVAELKKVTRINFKQILLALEKGAKGAVTICVATACAGIIVGCIMLTGIGTTFASFLNQVAGNSMILSLMAAMVATLLLGFGMPPTPVYIIMAALVIPSLVNMGINIIAAHYFVFYFSAVAGLTPPVAVTSYTAAAIAEEKPSLVSYKAFLYAIPAFILPFMMVFSPEILLQGNFISVTQACITSVIGIVMFVIGLHGYYITKLPLILRLCALAGGLLLVDSGSVTDLGGLALTALVFGYSFLRKKKGKQQPKPSTDLTASEAATAEETD